MHYGTRFFSKNDGKTIQSKEIGRSVDDQSIGKSYYKYDGPVLSSQDILETNLLYKCTKITGESASWLSVTFPIFSYRYHSWIYPYAWFTYHAFCTT